MSTLTELTEQLTALKTKLGALEAKIAELAQEPDPEPEWPVPVGEEYWAVHFSSGEITRATNRGDKNDVKRRGIGNMFATPAEAEARRDTLRLLFGPNQDQMERLKLLLELAGAAWHACTDGGYVLRIPGINARLAYANNRVAMRAQGHQLGLPELPIYEEEA